MRRIVVVVAALGLLVSAGQAAAAPGDSALELAGQAAASAQGAGAQSGASQSQPSNKNVSVRVLSPGDDGNVTQSNTVSSNATAANANVTGQSATQTQGGSCGCTGGTQATGQKADSSQAATALSYREAVRREQHEHPRQGPEPWRQRRRLADEQRRFRRDRCERQRHGPVRRAGCGGRFRNAGGRPGRGQQAGRRRSLGRRAEGRGEHEHLRARAQPRQGRRRDAVEQRRLVGQGRKPEPGRPEAPIRDRAARVAPRPSGRTLTTTSRRPRSQQRSRMERRTGTSRCASSAGATAETSPSRTASTRRLPPAT